MELREQKIFLIIKFVTILFFLLFYLSSCDDKNQEKTFLISNLYQIESLEYQDINDLEFLKEKIKKEEKKIQAIIKSQDKTASYYNILGLHYYNRGMYKLALESFEKAIEFYQNNKLLFYYSAKSINKFISSIPDILKQESLYQKSNSYLKRSIEIDDNFYFAKYELALNYYNNFQKEEAFILLNEFLFKGKSLDQDLKIKSLYLFAMVAKELDKKDFAIVSYKEILKNTKDESLIKKVNFLLEELINQ